MLRFPFEVPRAQAVPGGMGAASVCAVRTRRDVLSPAAGDARRERGRSRQVWTALAIAAVFGEAACGRDFVPEHIEVVDFGASDAAVERATGVARYRFVRVGRLSVRLEALGRDGAVRFAVQVDDAAEITWCATRPQASRLAADRDGRIVASADEPGAIAAAATLIADDVGDQPGPAEKCWSTAKRCAASSLRGANACAACQADRENEACGQCAFQVSVATTDCTVWLDCWAPE